MHRCSPFPSLKLAPFHLEPEVLLFPRFPRLATTMLRATGYPLHTVGESVALLAFHTLRQHESNGIRVGWHDTETMSGSTALSQAFLLQMLFTDAPVIQIVNCLYEGDFFLSLAYQ